MDGKTNGHTILKRGESIISAILCYLQLKSSNSFICPVSVAKSFKKCDGVQTLDAFCQSAYILVSKMSLFKQHNFISFIFSLETLILENSKWRTDEQKRILNLPFYIKIKIFFSLSLFKRQSWTEWECGLIVTKIAIETSEWIRGKGGGWNKKAPRARAHDRHDSI